MPHGIMDHQLFAVAQQPYQATQIDVVAVVESDHYSPHILDSTPLQTYVHDMPQSIPMLQSIVEGEVTHYHLPPDRHLTHRQVNFLPWMLDHLIMLNQIFLLHSHSKIMTTVPHYVMQLIIPRNYPHFQMPHSNWMHPRYPPHYCCIFEYHVINKPQLMIPRISFRHHPQQSVPVIFHSLVH